MERDMDDDTDDLDRFDPNLFGIWREAPAYGDPDSTKMPAELRGMFLETKSGENAVSPTETLRLLLNQMTEEMQAQFKTFRDMRRAAEGELADGDDAAQKLARADVKAATDAMSLIVRTLEKIDSLQRQLARDRREEAEASADRDGYEDARERLLQLIRVKADEQARLLFEAWKRDGKRDDDPGSAAASAGLSASPPAAVIAGTGPPAGMG